jgi:DNA-binding HxlR family transcriptional regulator
MVRMLGRTYDDQVCSVSRTLEVVGERWTLLIVRDALLGKRRFDEFQQSLGLARNILSDRLAKLVAGGILERVEYQERPARWEYVPTERGRDLRPVVLAMMAWGDRHAPNPAGPPRLAQHKGCGGCVTAGYTCASCGPIEISQVAVVPGPGAKA